MLYKAIIFDLNDVLLLDHPRQPNLELVGLLSGFKKQGLIMFTLSNASKEGMEYNQQNFDFLNKYFIKNYYSCQTGVYKPDPRAWQLILAENNLQPAECLYFDDSDSNIQAAKSLGIAAYLFKDAKDVRSKLK